MSKLSIEELISKRGQIIERAKTKTCLIHSEFLGGEIEFHSLDQGDLAYVRDKLNQDMMLGIAYFIYMSADDLRNEKLLEAYKCDKNDNYKIAERLFTEAERARIIEILQQLNGLNSINPNEIYQVQIEEIKN